MYAIVEIGGSQWKVEKAAVIRVPKIDEADGKKLDFGNVLLVVDKKKVEVGTPYVKNAVVKATVLGQGRDKKVMVFKKKRRKNYKVLKGHRQSFTELRIESISLGTGAAKTSGESKTKSEAPVKTAGTAAPKKTAAKKPAAKTPAKTASKKPTAKTAAKKDAKPAAPKTSAKKSAARPAPKKTTAKKAEKKKEQ